MTIEEMIQWAREHAGMCVRVTDHNLFIDTNVDWVVTGYRTTDGFAILGRAEQSWINYSTLVKLAEGGALYGVHPRNLAVSHTHAVKWQRLGITKGLEKLAQVEQAVRNS